MLLAEAGYRVVVRVLVRTEVAKGHVLVAGSLHPPGTHDSHAIAVQQRPHHHQRVIRRLPSTVPPPVVVVDLG